MAPIVAIFLIALGCTAYLLPAIIAGFREHSSAWGIFALNLFLGWSGILWIVALIWALSSKGMATQQTVIVNNHNNEGHQSVQPIYIPVPQTIPTHQMMTAPPNVPQLGSDSRFCPSCAETIKAAAVKCRFCGEQLSPALINHFPDN